MSTEHESALARRTLLGASMAGAGALGLGVPSAQAAPAPSRGPKNRVELSLLGTAGGPPPQFGRVGISSALTVDGHVYVIDAGRGAVTQYLEAGLTFASLSSIFLTHLHADHVCEYPNFFLLGGFTSAESGDGIKKPVHVYGPGPAGRLPTSSKGDPDTIRPDNPTPGLVDLTRSHMEAYAYSTNLFMRDSALPDPRTLMELHEIEVPDVGQDPVERTAPDMEPFPVMEDERVTVTAVLVPHAPVFPSFAFRFDVKDGPSVVFSGDTAASGNVVRLARGADVLVHEAIDLDWMASIDSPPALIEHLRSSHTSITDVGAIAQRAQVSTLVLSHLVPSNPELVRDGQWRSRGSRGFDGRVVVARDGMTLPLA